MSDDFEAMRPALDILMDDMDYRNRLGKKAMKLASQQFNTMVIRKRFKELLLSLFMEYNNH